MDLPTKIRNILKDDVVDVLEFGRDADGSSWLVLVLLTSLQPRFKSRVVDIFFDRPVSDRERRVLYAALLRTIEDLDNETVLDVCETAARYVDKSPDSVYPLIQRWYK